MRANNFSKVVSTFILAIVVAAMTDVTASVGAPERASLDPELPQSASLRSCASASELDCIEAVSVTIGGKKIVAKETGFEPKSPRPKIGGNIDNVGDVLFSYQVGSETRVIRIDATLETPEHKYDLTSKAGRLWTELNAGADNDKVWAIAIRTSWLKPLDAALYANNANFSDQPVKGGRKFTFTGSAQTVSGYTDAFDLKQKLEALADYDTQSFYFVIDHAANDDNSFYSVECADSGYAVTASNATVAGIPLWNEDRKSLDFNVAAPHRNTQGLLNEGYFKLWVSKNYADCRWPENNLSSAPYITVSVLDAGGNPEWAITQVTNSGGKIAFSASGFHYSSPTIALKASKTAPKSLGPKPKNFPSKKAVGTRITCIQVGNPTSKITLMSKNPKCPAGYKKK